MTSKLKTVFSRLGVALALGASSLASAAVIDGSEFTNGLTVQTIDGVNWVGSAAFQKKTMNSVTGVGISGGRTNDEIDIRETLTGTAASGTFGIGGFRLGVLFDGPEYGDWNEIAQITATRLGGSTIVHTLQADTATTAVWSGMGTVSNVLAAIEGVGAVWDISNNPFGNFTDFVSISFTALTSDICDYKKCTNQSDFTLVQLTTTEPSKVPEPASLALLGLGLVGLAAARRRRA